MMSTESRPHRPGMKAMPRVRYYAGLDVAQQRDYSALAILERVRFNENDIDQETEIQDRLVFLERWKVSYPVLLEKLDELFAMKMKGDRYPLARYTTLAVDATGPGLPFYEDLRRAGIGLRGIKPVIITSGQGKPSQHGTHVPKPYLITRLQLAFQNKAVKIPEGLAYLDHLTEELRGYEMKVTASRNITYSNNPREGGPEHDDLILAAALAYCNIERKGPRQSMRLVK